MTCSEIGMHAYFLFSHSESLDFIRYKRAPRSVILFVTGYNVSSIRGRLAWLSSSFIPAPRVSFLHPLFMLPVFEMHFKIFNRHSWARSVQLPGTVKTPDTRQVFVANFLPRVDACSIYQRKTSANIHRGVTHDPFEQISGIEASEIGQSSD
jgi:hypothetical protein